MEDGEVAHLLDKSSPEVADLVVVGVGLSLALAGVLSQTEQYCDQAKIQEDLMMICLAAQNKILTVFLLGLRFIIFSSESVKDQSPVVLN